MKEDPYKEKYPIYSYEVDSNAKARLTSIGNFIQDIAAKHAEILGFGFDDMRKMNLYWVLSRLKIRMIKYPVWRENIIIETWHSGIDRLFGNREFRFLSENGDKLGDATSSWLIINSKTRRPQNPENLHEDLPELRASSDVKSLDKLPSVEGGNDSPIYKIKYSDLDHNNHVNNVKYIQWILDSYPDGYFAKYQIATFEINFLAELSHSEKVRIRSVRSDQLQEVYHHSLFLADEVKEICRASISWEQTV